MIVDIYEYFLRHPGYNKLLGDDYLFLEYKCPINVEEFELWSEHHLITYVISGKKDWITKNETVELKAGDALFVRKGVYVTRQYLEVDYCVMLFFLTDDFIRRFVDTHCPGSAETPEQELFPVHADESFNLLIQSLFSYFKQGQVPQNLVDLKFNELLLNATLQPQNHELKAFLQTVGRNKIADLRHVMEQHFRSDLKLEDFARLAGRSLSSFKRDFGREFELPPAKWLTRRRLEHAGSLLTGTEMSVSEICYASGFKNPSHFTTAFKEQFGQAPGQYRLNPA